MGVFEDLSQFLETRLEEFLRDRPELELQALEEQLKEQEADTRRTLINLKGEQKKLEAQILETAQDVQRWHIRIEKVRAAGELKLAEAAQEREAALLRKGNQLWGHMEGVKDRIQAAEALLPQIQGRLREVQLKAQQVRAQQAAARSNRAQSSWGATGWNEGYPSNPTGYDPLEEAFRRWETDEELEDLKRQMGRS